MSLLETTPPGKQVHELETHENGLELNSTNLLQALESKHIGFTPSELRAFAAMVGTTHPFATWRESFGPILRKRGIATYTPVITEAQGGWNAEYAKVEAQALKEACVIPFGLENNGFENGGPASMVEIGFALKHAVERGQIVIIYVEDGFEQTITDRGMQRQFELMARAIEEAVQEHPENIILLADTTLGEFSQKTADAYHQQLDPEKCVKPEATKSAEIQPLDSTEKDPFHPQCILFGSSGPSDPSLAAPFQEELAAMHKVLGDQYVFLNEGIHAKPWLDAEQIEETETRMKAYGAAAEYEAGIKATAKRVVLFISKYSPSLGVLAEIGTTILDAAKHGKELVIFMEDFDAEACFQPQFTKEKDATRKSLQELTTKALNDATAAGDTTKIAELQQTIATANERLESGCPFKVARKDPFLMWTPVVMQVDRVYRARASAKEQLLVEQQSMSNTRSPLRIATTMEEFAALTTNIKL